ncbi:MAG TPA: hypothetical protein VMV10_18455 [Pirellulales bacterium]|nr:hypothetical protein [Pirellulales bacterium]
MLFSDGIMTLAKVKVKQKGFRKYIASQTMYGEACRKSPSLAASPDYSSAQLLLDKALHTNPKRQRGKCLAPPRLRFGLVWADE